MIARDQGHYPSTHRSINQGRSQVIYQSIVLVSLTRPHGQRTIVHRIKSAIVQIKPP
jgi:hypothetical protein